MSSVIVIVRGAEEMVTVDLSCIIRDYVGRDDLLIFVIVPFSCDRAPFLAIEAGSVTLEEAF